MSWTARAAVDRKLQQRYPRQVAHDVHAVDVGAEVIVHLGKFFGFAGGPLQVEPIGVARKEIEHKRGETSMRVEPVGVPCGPSGIDVQTSRPY